MNHSVGVGHRIPLTTYKGQPSRHSLKYGVLFFSKLQVLFARRAIGILPDRLRLRSHLVSEHKCQAPAQSVAVFRQWMPDLSWILPGSVSDNKNKTFYLGTGTEPDFWRGLLKKTRSCVYISAHLESYSGAMLEHQLWTQPKISHRRPFHPDFLPNAEAQNPWVWINQGPPENFVGGFAPVDAIKTDNCIIWATIYLPLSPP